MINLNSVTNGHASEHLSSRYRFIDTQDIVARAESKGWELNRAYESKLRKQSADGTQSHLLVFRKPSLGQLDLKTSSVIPELVIVNSHDGTRALRMALGLFRTACLNGLLSGISFKDFRTSHSETGLQRIAQGFDFVADNAQNELTQARIWSDIQLNPAQVQLFIGRCVAKRLESVQGEILSVGRTNPRRHQDLGSDAFTVLNRGQELMLRGGFNYVSRTEKDGEIQIRSRNAGKVYSIPQSIKLNQYAVSEMQSLLVD